MTKRTISEIVGVIVEELTPLGSEERQRVVRAALTLLGEMVVQPAKHGLNIVDEGDDENLAQLPRRARTWLQQNGVAMEQLEQVFQIEDGTVGVIASEVPGKNNKDRVRNAYVLIGVAQLLATGEPKFDDQTARSLCDSHGVYDSTNHAKYMKGGNEFVGSREKGWTLTAPGLKQGAELVKQLTQKS